MATLPIKSILQVTNYSGHHGTLTTEAPAQTFKLGNIVVADANGLTATATAATAAAGKIMFAAKDSTPAGTAVAKNAMPVVRPITNMIFEVTAGGAASSASNIAAGKQYGYAVDGTTGLGYLNLADTTNLVFELVQHDGDTLAPMGGAVGDTNVRVYARVIPSKL